MRTIKNINKGFLLKWLILFWGIFLSKTCFSQILNGSFETNDQPSLNNWLITCDGGESFNDAPADGGSWCLRLPEGNLQGCFPETAQQKISNIGNGDIWQVSVWARQYEKKTSPTSIYLKVFNTSGDSSVLSKDTTTAKDWTLLTIVDTLSIKEGDSVCIVLDAGVTSGPQLVDSYSYFDLVTATNIGHIVSVNDVKNLSHKDFKLFQNFPNPFNPATEISFSLPKESYISLKVFDILGREVYILAEGRFNAGKSTISFNAKNLPSGLYFYRLIAGNFMESRKMLLMK